MNREQGAAAAQSGPSPGEASVKNQPFLRLAILLMPDYQTPHYMTLVRQCGATDIVAPVPADPTCLEDLVALRDKISAQGLRLSVLERYWPHDKIVQALPGRRKQIDKTKALIANMGAAGIPTLCYNWMQSSDWTRTSGLRSWQYDCTYLFVFG